MRPVGQIDLRPEAINFSMHDQVHGIHTYVHVLTSNNKVIKSSVVNEIHDLMAVCCVEDLESSAPLSVESSHTFWTSPLPSHGLATVGIMCQSSRPPPTPTPGVWNVARMDHTHTNSLLYARAVVEVWWCMLYCHSCRTDYVAPIWGKPVGGNKTAGPIG